jgi:hypothetical protein
MRQKQAKRIVKAEPSVASLESSKASALEKMSEVHRGVAISIETSKQPCHLCPHLHSIV